MNMVRLFTWIGFQSGGQSSRNKYITKDIIVIIRLKQHTFELRLEKSDAGNDFFFARITTKDIALKTIYIQLTATTIWYLTKVIFIIMIKFEKHTNNSYCGVK